MKKTFLTFLPVAAAILLATSCGKDDDNGQVVNNIKEQPSTTELVQQPTTNVEENAYVSIPFSVGIASGEGLSKITCTTEEVEGKKVVHRSFDDGDLGKTLAVTGDDIDDSELKLVKDEGGNFKFSGNIKVKEEKVADFEAGNVKMRGVFGAELTEPKVSIVSLNDVMTLYAYEVCDEFSSNAENIELVDQNAYLHFKLATTQKRLKLDIANSPFEYGNKVVEEVDQEPFKVAADWKELWVAIPGGSKVKGNLVSTEGRTANAGLIINIDRHDVVDMQIEGCTVLWKTTNETTGGTPYNQSDAATSPYKNEHYYTWAQACAFGRMDGETYADGSADPFRLPTKTEFEKLATTADNSRYVEYNGMSCEKFSTDYGELFFPAASDGKIAVGLMGGYWSGTLGNKQQAYQLNFVNALVAVQLYSVLSAYSVRLVRGL